MLTDVQFAFASIWESASNDTQPKTNKETMKRRPAASGSDHGSKQHDSATHQAQSVTNALLRTKNMMQQELERVSALSTTIYDDGALLSGAREEHVGMGGAMKGAKGMLKKLGRQDVRDAFILRCAVVFYWLVVAYVLWSRIKVPFLP